MFLSPGQRTGLFGILIGVQRVVGNGLFVFILVLAVTVVVAVAVAIAVVVMRPPAGLRWRHGSHCSDLSVGGVEAFVGVEDLLRGEVESKPIDVVVVDKHSLSS